MEPNKEHIRHCLLFCFVFIKIKKSAANAYRIIGETYDENIIAIRTCVWFSDLKTVIKTEYQ